MLRMARCPNDRHDTALVGISTCLRYVPESLWVKPRRRRHNQGWLLFAPPSEGRVYAASNHCRRPSTIHAPVSTSYTGQGSGLWTAGRRLWPGESPD